jgi:DNA-binding MarR family transcriptional regulator
MHHTEFLEQFIKMMRVLHKTALPRHVINAKSTLTPLQLEALLYLHMHPKSTVSALGEYLQLSSSAIAQLTDRLAKASLLKRTPNPHDRRSVILSLTSKGERMFSRLHTAHREHMKKLMTHMPEKDLKELIRIFKNLPHHHE